MALFHEMFEDFQSLSLSLSRRGMVQLKSQQGCEGRIYLELGMRRLLLQASNKVIFQLRAGTNGLERYLADLIVHVAWCWGSVVRGRFVEHVQLEEAE